jgi:hypothetical protein
MNKITIINHYEDDWSALYVNGDFIFSNHTISLDDLVDHNPIESINRIDLADYPNCAKYIDDYGDFPKDKTLEEFLELNG